MEIAVSTEPLEAVGQEAWFVKCDVEGKSAGCLCAWKAWGLPALYESGVEFAFERGHGTGAERFDLPPTVYEQGWGDCAMLVIWRLCEINVSRADIHPETQVLTWTHPPATARVEWEGEDLHVYVRLPPDLAKAWGQEYEDPARLLGMPGD